MVKRRNWALAVVLISVLLVSLLGFHFSAQGQELPSRMFEVKSGSIQMQGGLLGLKDELMIFMVIGNKTGNTIWVEIEFRLPEKGDTLQGFEKIEEDANNMFRWPVSTVIWDVDYPFTVSVFEDENRKKLLGSEQSTYFFEGEEDRRAFEKSRDELSPGAASVVVGFHELGRTNLSAEVSGTKANSQLQMDITVRLFAEASKYHKECEHSVLKAEAYETTEPSVIASEMGEEYQEMEQRLRARNEMFVEKWFVQSCETVDIYEVLLLKSGTGTDISVKKLESVK